ncbi:MAG: hypothetical protein M3347_13035 [Armatimonadota bacterium]|nr:hypothetical protein [Armatimonadota bacterium]
MRKAAGLLVEMPEEPAASGEGSAEDAATADIDQLLSKVDQTAAAVNRAEGKTETKTVEQIVRETKGPNLDEIKVDPGKADPAGMPPPITPDGKVNLPAIYQQAKLPAAPFSAEQMLEMLASLPGEVPLDTKRQMVKVTLGALGKTMGATPETVVADASRKLAALAAYVEYASQQTEKFVTGAESEIAALQAQIEDKRRAIESTRQRLTQLTQAIDQESDRLDDVLEFFSLDVPPSKYATEKPETKKQEPTKK